MSAIGSWSSAHFNSCRQAMSGCSRSSHSSRRGIRARIPLMLNVASFMQTALVIATRDSIRPGSYPETEYIHEDYSRRGAETLVKRARQHRTPNLSEAL